jgi:cytoskeletal protein RodZ
VTAALVLHACDQLNDTGRAAAISTSLHEANIQPISNSELLHWLAHRHGTTIVNNSVAETDVHADDQQSVQTASDSSNDSSDDTTQQYSADTSSATTSSDISDDAVIVTHTKATFADTAMK